MFATRACFDQGRLIIANSVLESDQVPHGKPYSIPVFTAASWWRETLKNSPFHQSENSKRNIEAFVDTLNRMLGIIFDDNPASIACDLPVPLSSSIIDEAGCYRLDGMLDIGTAGRYARYPDDTDPFWMPDEFVETGGNRFMIVSPSLVIIAHDEGEYLVIEKILECSEVGMYDNRLWSHSEKMSIYAATIWWHLSTMLQYSSPDPDKFAEACCALTSNQAQAINDDRSQSPVLKYRKEIYHRLDEALFDDKADPDVMLIAGNMGDSDIDLDELAREFDINTEMLPKATMYITRDSVRAKYPGQPLTYVWKPHAKNDK